MATRDCIYDIRNWYTIGVTFYVCLFKRIELDDYHNLFYVRMDLFYDHKNVIV